MEKLGQGSPTMNFPSYDKKYKLTPNDFMAACQIIELCIHADVSPVRVNQGIWYFCANAVACPQRLCDLIRCGDINKIKAEIELMEGFLPNSSRWL